MSHVSRFTEHFDLDLQQLAPPASCLAPPKSSFDSDLCFSTTSTTSTTSTSSTTSSESERAFASKLKRFLNTIVFEFGNTELPPRISAVKIKGSGPEYLGISHPMKRNVCAAARTKSEIMSILVIQEGSLQNQTGK
ncbi:hypothetical protein EC973_002763 [Apophysomyces ossiformis]|uniref:Uncharacterized protein n=1 Tax=Apophysomyces ossiformis TaxID=679940 RepID=A0A8H7BQX3_9FUNG|nr:hypothetical protein EC973_002763 [Apophysomyces ossiformis]